MVIPWLQVYSNLPSHPKVSRLADLLGLNHKHVQPEVIAVGIVINLWTWAIQNCPNGFLTVSTRAIAKACGWTGNPDVLYEALIAADFVESDGYIHDWDEYAGLLLEQDENRKAKTRERVKRYREQKCNADVTQCNADVTRYKSVTGNALRNADVTHLPNQTKPNIISVLDKEGEKDNCVPPTPIQSEPNQSKPVKHKHGEYGNVMLTDEDLAKLKEEFPHDWDKRIERLSSYIASTGKTYKNHLATIRNWARMDKEKGIGEAPKSKNRSFSADNVKAYEEWSRNVIRDGARGTV